MRCTLMLGGFRTFIQVKGEDSELRWSLLTLHSSTTIRIAEDVRMELKKTSLECCRGAHPSLALGVDFSC